MFKLFSSIRGKLVAAFAFLALLVLVLGIISYVGADQLATNEGGVSHDILPGIQIASQLRGDINATRFSIAQHIAAQSPAELSHREDAISAWSKRVTDDFAAYRKLPLSTDESSILNQIETSWASYQNQLPKLLDLSKANKDSEANAFYDANLAPIDEANESAVQRLVDLNARQVEASDAASEALQFTVKAMTLGAILAATLASIVCAVTIIRSISRGIEGLIGPISRLASGGLKSTFPCAASGPSLDASPMPWRYSNRGSSRPMPSRRKRCPVRSARSSGLGRCRSCRARSPKS